MLSRFTIGPDYISLEKCRMSIFHLPESPVDHRIDHQDTMKNCLWSSVSCISCFLFCLECLVRPCSSSCCSCPVRVLLFAHVAWIRLLFSTSVLVILLSLLSLGSISICFCSICSIYSSHATASSVFVLDLVVLVLKLFILADLVLCCACSSFVCFCCRCVLLFLLLVLLLHLRNFEEIEKYYL